MLGESGVGKTSIRRSFMGLSFIHSHRATIGGDFSIKHIHTPTFDVAFSIWEVDPSHNFRRMRRHYIKNSYTALIVFDCTDYTSNVNTILSTIREFDRYSQPKNQKLPVYLIGNKVDLVESSAPILSYIEKELQTRSELQNREIRVLFTSAITGENINEMFYLLIQSIFTYMQIDEDY